MVIVCWGNKEGGIVNRVTKAGLHAVVHVSKASKGENCFSHCHRAPVNTVAG